MITEWIQIVIGLWIIIAPWLLGLSVNSIMTLSSLIAGIIIVLINVWEIFRRE